MESRGPVTLRNFVFIQEGLDLNRGGNIDRRCWPCFLWRWTKHLELVTKFEGYPEGLKGNGIRHDNREGSHHGELHPHGDEMQVPE